MKNSLKDASLASPGLVSLSYRKTSVDEVYRKVKSTFRLTSSMADPSVRAKTPATMKRKPDRSDPLGISDSAAAAVNSNEKPISDSGPVTPSSDPENAEMPRSSVF